MTASILSSLTRPVISPHLSYLICRHASTSNKINCTVYDLVVVGGGIVGCATARELLCRHPNLKIALVEKENELGKHQTTHNSGVVHGGIYYKPGSNKAKLCVEGLKLSYEYFCKKGIEHKKIGKLIVATNPDQCKTLNTLFERGMQNNVPDIELVDKDCIPSYEPRCKGEKAIWSPWTGIVDWSCVCKHFAEDFKSMGGEIYLNYQVNGFAEMVASSEPCNQLAPMVVQSKERCILAKYALTCAGLYSDRLATMTGCCQSPKIIPFRGEYLLLKESKSCLCSTNIYPVPDSRFPFLGVHFTPKLNNQVWLGPNAVIAFAKEGYKWTNINIQDCIEIAKFPGFYKMAFKYFVPGVKEIIKSIFYPLAVQDLQAYIPEITYKDVKRGPSGVRAQALDSDGNLVDDFVFDYGTGAVGCRVLHCRNAPSPAATSSMAIAKYIADKIDCDFKF